MMERIFILAMLISWLVILCVFTLCFFSERFATWLFSLRIARSYVAAFMKVWIEDRLQRDRKIADDFFRYSGCESMILGNFGSSEQRKEYGTKNGRFIMSKCQRKRVVRMIKLSLCKEIESNPGNPYTCIERFNILDKLGWGDYCPQEFRHKVVEKAFLICDYTWISQIKRNSVPNRNDSLKNLYMLAKQFWYPNRILPTVVQVLLDIGCDTTYEKLMEKDGYIPELTSV